MPTSLSPRSNVAVLPSLPPSPSLLEEVFSHPRPWSIRHDEFDSRGLRRSPTPEFAGNHTKGKGKKSSEEEDEDEEDTQHRSGTHESYPPTSDEAAETRRVEETLKRWELAERQRRKLARESAQHTPSPSLLSSVTRTASLVLSRQTSIGPSGTRVFKSHEAVDVAREGYAVPLDDIDHSPSIFDRSTSFDASSGSGTSENPFVHPSERILAPVTPTPALSLATPRSPSPFADVHVQKVLQACPTARVSAESKTDVPKRPSRNSVPPLSPSHMTPLQPTSQPVLRPLRRGDLEDRQEVQWWHEWLCGCGEGPDRGGDNQAGRTNPFE